MFKVYVRCNYEIINAEELCAINVILLKNLTIFKFPIMVEYSLNASMIPNPPFF